MLYFSQLDQYSNLYISYLNIQIQRIPFNHTHASTYTLVRHYACMNLKSQLFGVSLLINNEVFILTNSDFLCQYPN